MLDDFIIIGVYYLVMLYVACVVAPKLGSAFVDRLHRQATEELKKRDRERER